jgi:hypothetical protein
MRLSRHRMTCVFLLFAALLAGNAFVQKQLDIHSLNRWEMQTVELPHGVNKAIEQGQLDTAIVQLVAKHLIAPETHRGAVLGNLCLGYMLKRDYASARALCDLSLQQESVSRDVYNISGVLHAQLGDYSHAVNDFAAAACGPLCPANLAHSDLPPHPLIARNLERAIEQRSAMMTP